MLALGKNVSRKLFFCAKRFVWLLAQAWQLGMQFFDTCWQDLTKSNKVWLNQVLCQFSFR